MEVLLAGATGLTGSALLKELVSRPEITRIYAWGRRAPSLANDRIVFIPMDGPLPSMPWAPDRAFCCLGTTLRVAGSKEAFREVDVRMVERFAQLAKQQGVRCFVMQSSVGARPGRNFYLQCKYEAEAACAKLGFKRMVVVRPSILLGGRSERRIGEFIGIGLARIFAFIIPKRYKAIAATDVARAMWRLSQEQTQELCIAESEMLVDLSKSLR